MKPQKKQIDNLILYGMSLILIVYFTLHSAICYEEVEESSPWLMPFLQALGKRIEARPFQFQINQYTSKFLAWSCFGWFLIVAAIENSRKNYIHGKEFGTSKWATKKEIQDLFSDTILSKELRKSKKLKYFFGRFLIARQIQRNHKRVKTIVVQQRLLPLKDALKKGTIKRKEYEKQKKQICIDEETQMWAAIEQEWEPFLWQREMREKIAKIPASEKRKVKKLYTRKMREFGKEHYKEQVKSLNNRLKNSDIILSKTEKVCVYNLEINMNMILLGGSGAGKTRGYILSNILQLASAGNGKGGLSFAITDPKGEILEKVGYYLEHIQHYKIRVLNLDNMEESDRLNPFHYIHPERPGYEENILSLVETIIINTESDEAKTKTGDPFWDKAERMFLQSLFFFVSDGFCEEERNTETLLKLISMLHLEEENDEKNSQLDYFVDIFAKKFGEDHMGVQIFREFRNKATGKMAQSIVMSALVRLTPFRTPAVRRILEKDDMELERIGEEKMAIFVIVPPTNSTYNFIAGIMFTLLFQEIQYCATQIHKHDGQKLPVRCQFFLDEHANTCKIPNIQKITAYGRSFGLGITFGIQSLEQLKNMYKQSWGTLMDNCSTLLFLGSISHLETLKYMSELLAKATYDKKTTGRTRGRQGSSSRNEDVVGRELMDVSDLRKLEKKDCIIVISGRNPFYSEKFDYTSHPAYIFTSDANKAYSYYYTPERRKSPHGEENNEEAAQTAQTVIEDNSIKITMSDNDLVEISKQIQHYYPLMDSDLFRDSAEQESFYNFIKEEEEEVKRTHKIINASKETIQFIHDQKKKNTITIEQDEDLEKALEKLQKIELEVGPISDRELDAEYETYKPEWEEEADDDFFAKLQQL